MVGAAAAEVKRPAVSWTSAIEACRIARRRGYPESARPVYASEAMELRAEPHGPHVVVVTIDNQPRRNAMPRAMLAELATLWDRLAADAACRCIVLTGAGDRAFTSGADMSGDLSADPEMARRVNHALLKNRPFAKPIVAAVNGDCVAGGLELLLSTDVRAAAPHARFGLPEVRWSIYPFGGATVKLTQQIGHVHAMELLLTAKLIDANEAARIGLVNRVLPADRVMPWVLQTAATIAANSPTAVQAVKQQISSTIADHARSREPLEQELGDHVRRSAHFTEGVRAFLEKRNPNYT
jgi:enoyl-CoA hydratase